MALSNSLLKAAIIRSQALPLFAARGAYSFDRGLRRGLIASRHVMFAKSEIEYADCGALQASLRHSQVNVVGLIKGKRVLDLGSGYGGRTVWYAEHASEVFGVDVHANLVQESIEYANYRKRPNCHFSLGNDEQLQFPSDYFDVVVSTDVLEHVRDPRLMLHEIHKVLKPRGVAAIVFTPYFGAFSHHLNYITMLPALHWLFSPSTIVSVTNDLLQSHPRFAKLGVQPQPLPRLAYHGRHRVLPALNGMTKRDYRAEIERLRFESLFLRTTPILEHFKVAHPIGPLLNRLLCRLPLLDEAFGHNLVSVLRKPSSAR